METHDAIRVLRNAKLTDEEAADLFEIAARYVIVRGDWRSSLHAYMFRSDVDTELKEKHGEPPLTDEEWDTYYDAIAECDERYIDSTHCRTLEKIIYKRPVDNDSTYSAD